MRFVSLPPDQTIQLILPGYILALHVNAHRKVYLQYAHHPLPPPLVFSLGLGVLIQPRGQ
jgi:hypothetical protein